MPRHRLALEKYLSFSLLGSSLLVPWFIACASALPPDEQEDPSLGTTALTPTMPPATQGTPAPTPAATTPTGPGPVIIGTAGTMGGGLFGEMPDTTDTNVSGLGEGGAAGQPGATSDAGTSGIAGSAGAPPVVSPSGCDFTLVATTCAAQACARCNPQPMFDLNFTTTCEAIITCVDTSGCSTEEDLLCAVRVVATGAPNTCTSQAEQGGIGNDSGMPTPYSCALALYQCACTVP